MVGVSGIRCKCVSQCSKEQSPLAFFFFFFFSIFSMTKKLSGIETTHWFIKFQALHTHIISFNPHSNPVKNTHTQLTIYWVLTVSFTMLRAFPNILTPTLSVLWFSFYGWGNESPGRLGNLPFITQLEDNEQLFEPGSQNLDTWMCACMLSHFSHVQLFVTLWTIAC